MNKQWLCLHSFVLFILISIQYSSLNAAVIGRLVPVIVSKLPHDRHAFTQGLAIENDQLYESTGLYGKSSLRHIDILTGKVLQKQMLPFDHFAEGIAAFSNRIYQITWKEQRLFIYDRHTLSLQQVLFFPGEGWGLCRDKNTLWMSNGTSTLIQRGIQNLDVHKQLEVHYNGRSVPFLNDLEYDGKYLYANVWYQDFIVQIDVNSGEVTGIIDVSRLLSRKEKSQLGRDHVLNGIAFRPKTGTFFLTGKNWPWIFEVRFVSAQDS